MMKSVVKGVDGIGKMHGKNAMWHRNGSTVSRDKGRIADLQ